MPTEADRRLAEVQALMADKAMIEAAAACMRYEGVQQYYAGFQRKEIAYGFAAVLDTLAMNVRTLAPGVRQEIVSMCEEFTRAIERDEEDYHRRTGQ